jgi:hypothetical protein
MKQQVPRSIKGLYAKSDDYSISATDQFAPEDEIFVILPPSDIEHNGIVQVGGSGSGSY